MTAARSWIMMDPTILTEGIDAPAVDVLPATRRKASRVVNDRRLKRRQHIHSAVVTAAGISGLAAGVAMILLVGPPAIVAIVAFVAFFLATGLGVTVGLHRHFTHCSFSATAEVRVALAILGCMAAQGPVVFWVALHRMHHEFSDRVGDPHSPNLDGVSWRERARGLLHAYIGWTLCHDVPNANYYARDLIVDREIMAVDRLYYVWIASGLTLPAMLCGLCTMTWVGALDGLIWGGLIRMLAVHNIIWWITSFAHVFGHREFSSRDLSTNNAWLALPTLGESWHNNHHAFPTAPVLSFQQWQIDPSGLVIRLLERLGLAWELHHPTTASLAARRRAAK
jgi:stearoyl-CoA desaturase (Delta-9 desaturase)